MTGPLSVRVGRAFFGRFDKIREVQELAIAAVLAGGDVLIRAGTGSGKTEAAAAPLTQRYLSEHDAGDGVVVVYISPTRALANDLFRRLEPVYDSVGLRVGIRHGERNDLKRVAVPQVLVTTPESLDVMVGQREPRLVAVRALVFDEIHLMANTQRGLQLAIAAHRLELLIDRRVQVVGLSATVADPTAVWQFVRPRTLPTVVDEREGARDLKRQVRIGLTHVEVADRLGRLAGDGAKVLMFANSRRECDALADVVRAQARFGDDVYSHHSSLSKEHRERVEHDFERGERGVCVATSTLELGIDIGDVNLVVLYGIPANWQSLLQRCGRGNRRSSVIEALCVVPAPRPDEELGIRELLGFQALLRQVDSGALDAAMPFEMYGAAAQQLVSYIHGENGAFVGFNSLCRILEPWPHLDAETTEAILDELVAVDVLKRHPVYRRYGASEGLWQLAKDLLIWSNIPLSSREVELHHGSATLGRIPATNILRLHEGRTFAFSGRRWEVEAFSGGSIRVRPTSRAPDTELKFGRRGAPIDAAVVDQTRELLFHGDVGADVAPLELATRLRHDLAALQTLADPALLPCGSPDGGRAYLTFAGTLANQVIAVWAGADPRQCDAFILRSPESIRFESLPEPSDLLEQLALVEMDEGDASEFQRRLPVSLRRLEMQNEWLRHPTNQRVLERLRNAHEVDLPGRALPLVRR